MIEMTETGFIGGRKGLSNKSLNLCFANSLFQCLASLPGFSQRLSADKIKNETLKQLQCFLEMLGNVRSTKSDLEEGKMKLFKTIERNNAGVYY